MGCVNSTPATSPNSLSVPSPGTQIPHFQTQAPTNASTVPQGTPNTAQNSLSVPSPPRVPSFILQSHFEKILEFFEIPYSENCFINIFNFLDSLRDPNIFLKVSLKFTKIIFELYDSDKNAYLDQEELRRFYTDWKGLVGGGNISEWERQILANGKEMVSYEDFIAMGLLEHDLNEIMKRQQQERAARGAADDADDLMWDDEEEQRQMEEQQRTHDALQQNIHSLKSDTILLKFEPVLKFFRIRTSHNLLKDMMQLKEALFNEATNQYPTKKLQRQIVERLLKYTFEFYDQDNSGWMSREELIRFMDDVMEALPPDEDEYITAELMVDELMRDLDVDQNNQIDYHEIHQHLPLIYQRMMTRSNNKRGVMMG